MRRVELYAKDVSQLASPSAINNLVGSHPCIFLYMHDQQQTLSSRPLKPDVQLHYRVAAEFNKFQPFYKHLIPRLSKEERRIFKLITSAPSNSKSSSTSSLSPPPSYLVDSLVLLCRLLQQSHPQRAKCVVVINGVDHHLHQFNKTHLASQCSELYQAFYRRTFNHNPYLHLGVIIGEESLVHWEKFNVASGSFRIIEETDPIYSSINRYLRVETPWDKQDVFE